MTLPHTGAHPLPTQKDAFLTLLPYSFLQARCFECWARTRSVTTSFMDASIRRMSELRDSMSWLTSTPCTTEKRGQHLASGMSGVERQQGRGNGHAPC